MVQDSNIIMQARVKRNGVQTSFCKAGHFKNVRPGSLLHPDNMWTWWIPKQEKVHHTAHFSPSRRTDTHQDGPTASSFSRARTSSFIIMSVHVENYFSSVWLLYGCSLGLYVRSQVYCTQASYVYMFVFVGC